MYEDSVTKCPNCGQAQTDGRFCKACGTEFPIAAEHPQNHSPAHAESNVNSVPKTQKNEQHDENSAAGPRTGMWIACIAIILVALAVFYFSANGFPTFTSQLESAYDSCSASNEFDSLSYDSKNDALTINDTTAYDCIVDKLQIPSQITERVSSANTLMGEQSGSWDKYSATWSYNGGSGDFLMVITKQ